MKNTMRTNRPTWDEHFLNEAKTAAEMSKDPSTQVGAVIVRPNKSIASKGFNGFPQSMPDTPEMYVNREEKYNRIIHAEMNALIFSKENVTGYTLYVWPFMPCDRCFVHLVQAGITRFVSPIASSDINTRWGSSFDRVRQYAAECGVEIVEISLPEKQE